MRVVVCGRGAADARSSVWAHVTSSLRAHGYEVVAFDPTAPGGSGLVRGDAVASLRRLLADQKPHLLVHVPTPGDLSSADVRMLTSESETVAVALHMGSTFRDAPTRVADATDHLRDYDLVAVPDRWTAADLTAIGDYRLYCVEPAVHAPSLEDAVPGTRSGAVIVGEPDDRAADIARALLDIEVDLRLYGDGWASHPDLEPHSYDRVPYSEMGTVLAGAALLIETPLPVETQSLLLLSPWEAALSQCVFDAASVATPSLTLERAGVAAHMSSGENVLTYRRDADITTLVPMLLADAEALDIVGEAAADCVRAGHRWVDRWSELLAPFIQPDDDGEAVVVRSVTEDASQRTSSLA